MEGEEAMLKLKNPLALTGVAQLVGHCPTNQKVASLILGQGTSLGGGPGPWLGVWGVCKRQLMDVSLAHQCFIPSLALSLKIKSLKNKNNISSCFL